MKEVTVTLNQAKHGIELRFPTIPEERLRKQMLAAGWGFSKFNRVGGQIVLDCRWWHRTDAKAEKYARTLADMLNANLKAQAETELVPAVTPVQPKPQLEQPAARFNVLEMAEAPSI